MNTEMYPQSNVFLPPLASSQTNWEVKSYCLSRNCAKNHKKGTVGIGKLLTTRDCRAYIPTRLKKRCFRPTMLLTNCPYYDCLQEALRTHIAAHHRSYLKCPNPKLHKDLPNPLLDSYILNVTFSV